VAGHDDVAAFRQLFARSTGLTPSEYRARHRATTQVRPA
jgi:transcriptional regulator GlxA family with amidase domain